MNIEGYQPPLRIEGYSATRKGEADRGPVVRMNSAEARIRVLEDGELVWVYGPRRHEMAKLVIDDSVGRGGVVARDIAGVAPSEIVRVVKHDFDAGKSRRTLG